jgi:hypothetical protein
VWLPAWLTAANDAWCSVALALVAAARAFTGAVVALGPVQTPPPNPTAAGPGDGRVLSGQSSRVHEPCSSTEVVALRSRTGLTGSGSHIHSHGGFGGGYRPLHPHTSCRKTQSHQHPARGSAG